MSRAARSSADTEGRANSGCTSTPRHTQARATAAARDPSDVEHAGKRAAAVAAGRAPRPPPTTDNARARRHCTKRLEHVPQHALWHVLELGGGRSMAGNAPALSRSRQVARQTPARCAATHHCRLARCRSPAVRWLDARPDTRGGLVLWVASTRYHGVQRKLLPRPHPCRCPCHPVGPRAPPLQRPSRRGVAWVWAGSRHFRHTYPEEHLQPRATQQRRPNPPPRLRAWMLCQPSKHHESEAGAPLTTRLAAVPVAQALGRCVGLPAPASPARAHAGHTATASRLGSAAPQAVVCARTLHLRSYPAAL